MKSINFGKNIIFNKNIISKEEIIEEFIYILQKIFSLNLFLFNKKFKKNINFSFFSFFNSKLN